MQASWNGLDGGRAPLAGARKSGAGGFRTSVRTTCKRRMRSIVGGSDTQDPAIHAKGTYRRMPRNVPVMAKCERGSGIRSYAVLGDLQVRRDIAVDLGSPKATRRARRTDPGARRGRLSHRSIDRHSVAGRGTGGGHDQPGPTSPTCAGRCGQARRAPHPSSGSAPGTGLSSATIRSTSPISCGSPVPLAWPATTATGPAHSPSHRRRWLCGGDLAGGELGEASWLVAEAAALARPGTPWTTSISVHCWPAAMLRAP